MWRLGRGSPILLLAFGVPITGVCSETCWGHWAPSPSLPWSFSSQPAGSRSPSLPPGSRLPEHLKRRPHSQALSPRGSLCPSPCTPGSSRPQWSCPWPTHFLQPLLQGVGQRWGAQGPPSRPSCPSPSSPVAARFLLNGNGGSKWRDFLSSVSSGASTVQNGRQGHFSRSCCSHSLWDTSCFHPCSWPRTLSDGP